MILNIFKISLKIEVRNWVGKNSKRVIWVRGKTLDYRDKNKSLGERTTRKGYISDFFLYFFFI